METQTATLRTPPQAVAKTIVWDTNFNNKLLCNAFVHIDLPPRERPTRAALAEMLVEIRTADRSHPPVLVRITDLLIEETWLFGDSVTLPSHGMQAEEFHQWFLQTNRLRPDDNRKLCLWQYKRV